MAENPWKIIAKKKIYDNPWIGLTEFDVINPGGGKGIYGKVHYKNLAVGIMVLDDEKNTWLVGQYRFPTDRYSWEIPEGGCPEGSDLLLSAKRELKEETGLIADNWELILTMQLSNSVSDEIAYVYLATGLRQEVADPEETEQLHIKKIPFAEAYAMVNNGAITDSISIAAILKIQLLIAEGKLK